MCYTLYEILQNAYISIVQETDQWFPRDGNEEEQKEIFVDMLILIMVKHLRMRTIKQDAFKYVHFIMSIKTCIFRKTRIFRF